MIQSLGDGQLTDATTLETYQQCHLGAMQFQGGLEMFGMLRVKIFLWHAVKRRHWTMDHRRRHKLEAHPLCHLCVQAEETYDDLFFTCPFTFRVW